MCSGQPSRNAILSIVLRGIELYGYVANCICYTTYMNVEQQDSLQIIETTSSYPRPIDILLLSIIAIGLLLLVTQKLWVPTLVDSIVGTSTSVEVVQENVAKPDQRSAVLPLPQNVSWTESTATTSIFYTTPENDGGTFTIKGQEWSASLTGLETNDRRWVNLYDYYYNKFLEDKAWVINSVFYNNHKIHPPNADGVNGGQFAFLSPNGLTLKVVIFSSYSDGIRTSDPGEPYRYECPCHAKYSIFESDPISLDDINWGEGIFLRRSETSDPLN